MRFRWFATVISAALVLSPTVPAAFGAEAELGEAHCDKEAVFADHEQPSDGRQYARDRVFDVLHVTIDVTPNFERRTISGATTTRFSPLSHPLAELRLDAGDLTIESVESDHRIAGYQVTKDEIIVSFEEPIGVGEEAEVTIRHEAEPTQGLYFRTPAMGYRPGDTHLFTQGQPIDSRHWFPSVDSPNEKFTSEIICRVPEGMTAIANGSLVGEEKDPSTGLAAFRWLQEKPHPSYLIALCAGYFEKVTASHGDLPLAFWTPPSYIEHAEKSFRRTDEMMDFFEKEIGVDYPWAKYDQVVVDDFVAGGMENTSLTILTTRTLFSDETENLRDSESLVAHELAHQWFGDYVTCKDWGETWLNEGFASYYDLLFAGHVHGADHMRYRLLQDATNILGRTDGPRPIVNREWSNPNFQFGYRSYQKGAWVLHMLRARMGEEAFREAIKLYLERNAFGSVVTADLNAAVEDVSGGNYDRFFDQWIYHGRFPELDVEYRWQAREGLAKITVKQTQETSGDVLLFHFPLKIRFTVDGGPQEREIEITEERHDFYFPLESAPTIVRVDPDVSLLAKIDFRKPSAMLYAQLADDDDAIGRVLAARGLGAKKDRTTIARLKRALNGDDFYGVRAEAAAALEKIHNPKAYEALADSLDQSDARARSAVVAGLAGFWREENAERLISIAEDEKNPRIAAAAIRALGRYPANEQAEAIMRLNLGADSFGQALAAASLAGVRSLDDAEWIGPIRSTLEDRAGELPSGVLAQGLDTLAYVARNEEDRDEVRDFLTGYANHPRPGIQAAALRALGTLGDPKAIAVVETFTGGAGGSSTQGLFGARPDRVQRAAEGALRSLRANESASEALSGLRTELQTVKRDNEKLRGEMNDLKARFDALNHGDSELNAAPRRPRWLRWFSRSD